MSELLTQDKKRLVLFDDGVVIDQKLPKWKNASERATKHESIQSKIVARQTRMTENGTSTTDMATPFTVYSTPEPYEIKETVSFDEIAAASLKELTEMIKGKELNNILSSYGGMHGYTNTIVWGGDKLVNESNGNGLFNKIKNLFKKASEPKPEFNAIDFFTKVKLASKDSAQLYCDRVSKYLKAIHNANTAGQTALIETLLKEMIANKYESLLFAEGYYYAVSEKNIVDFAKKTEKGISLTYLKNFIRPLPQEVIDKIETLNKLEVFDNYVILHYDPEGKSYKETEKEVAKRKDPILFGVIAGSNKLYYIIDWIDEYCDLTLEKFVDTLNINVEELNFDGDRKSEKLKEIKKANKKKEKSPKKAKAIEEKKEEEAENEKETTEEKVEETTEVKKTEDKKPKAKKNKKGKKADK